MNRPNRFREPVGGRDGGGTALPAGFGDVGVADLHPARLGGLECRPGAFRDHVPFVFRHGSEDVDGEAGGVRHVAGAELHPAFHEVRDERHVARQPVELGDQQRDTLAPAEFERLLEFPAGSSACALTSVNSAIRVASFFPEMRGDGRFSGFEPEPGASLLVGRYPVVGDPKRKVGHISKRLGAFKTLKVYGIRWFLQVDLQLSEK